MTKLDDKQVASPDLNQERLQELKDKFPDLFTDEGELDPRALHQLVQGDEGVGREQYAFTWHGKAKAKHYAFTPSRAALTYDPERSVRPAKANGNIIIEGENLEVLKLLTAAYRGKVKCIYIDPPYNTGGDFVYPDNYAKDRKEYWEETGSYKDGVKLDTNPETSGRYHSDWLSIMYSRLLLARSLLKDDGVIFVSIGDEEVHNLRKILDEVFGDENFEGHVHWRRRHNQPNDPTKMLGLVAEHILVFAKYSKVLKSSGVGKVPLTGQFSNPDNDPRGDWASKPWKVGTGQSGTKYKIITSTGKEYDEEWMGDETTYMTLLRDNRIIFPRNGSGSPRKKYFKSEREEEGQSATNWWHHKQFGSNQDGSRELSSIFGVPGIFDNPKPSQLIKNIISVANVSDGDIVLDFFAGSGSSAHATMEFNAEYDVNAHFVLVQLPESIAKDEPAYQAGFKKISDITIERNKRVIEGYGKDPKPIDTGFKVYRLTKSNFPRAEFVPDPDKSEEENVKALEQYIAEKESSFQMTLDGDTILDEVLLKHGFPLDYAASKQEQFSNNTVYLAEHGGRRAYVCLDPSLDDDTIDYFKKNTDTTLICLERALDTTKKWNLNHSLGERLKAL